MKYRYIFLLFALFSLASCTSWFVERTPEYILWKVYGLNVENTEHWVYAFEEQWCPNGDGTLKIKMKVALTEEQIEHLISKGAKPLPIPDGTIIEQSWLEGKLGVDLDSKSDGVYFYEPGNPDLSFECKILLYDKETKMLYYYVNIM